MFRLYTISDVVRVAPDKFRYDLEETIKEVVTDDRVGFVDADLGVVLGVTEVNKVGEASVLLGDGAAYVDTTYTLIAYKPEIQSVAEGDVKEIAEFGAFVSLGPFDGLVHVSQIMDDFINYDNKIYAFVGRDSSRALHKMDNVIARIVSVSIKGNVTQSKIGLTMRQEGLGKDDWDQVKAQAMDKAEKKEKAPKAEKAKK